MGYIPYMGIINAEVIIKDVGDIVWEMIIFSKLIMRFWKNRICAAATDIRKETARNIMTL